MSPWSEQYESYYSLCGHDEQIIYIIKKFRHLSLTLTLMNSNNGFFWKNECRKIKEYITKFYKKVLF